jgi:hypothetical protein
MSKNIELRLEYVKLIQQGKEKEAQEVLKKIWALKGQSTKEAEPKKPAEEVVEKPKKIEKEEKKKTPKKESIDSLIKIKGIGKETLKDIKLIYSDLEDLKKDLSKGNDLPLRNDIEDKIKKHFNK